MAHPVYHLRPHKAVDRNLFCEALIHVGKIADLSKYRYIGFGSYEFDEYKLLYRMIGLEDMHSIERDSSIYDRQKFNKPYASIQLFNKDCTAYFDEDYDETKQSIVWLDFSDAHDKLSQCNDIAYVCGKLAENDILRITMNAQPSSIKITDSQERDISSEEKSRLRFNELKSILGNYFPDDATPEDVTQDKYPLLLSKIVKNAAYADLDEKLAPIPLCMYSYTDGQQMMTVTLIMGRSDEDSKTKKLEELRKAFSDWQEYSCVGGWEQIIKIDLPPLTVHEQLELRQAPRTEEGLEDVSERTGIKMEDIRKYYKYVRYYPNFQPVTI